MDANFRMCAGNGQPGHVPITCSDVNSLFAHQSEIQIRIASTRAGRIYLFMTLRNILILPEFEHTKDNVVAGQIQCESKNRHE